MGSEPKNREAAREASPPVPEPEYISGYIAGAAEALEAGTDPALVARTLRDYAHRVKVAPAPPAGETLSLSVQDDPLAITALLADGQREREMYHQLVADIRRVLGDDARDVLLADLPHYIAQRMSAPPAGEPDMAVKCSRCGAVWGEHIGPKCPDGEGTFQSPPACEEAAREASTPAIDRCCGERAPGDSYGRTCDKRKGHDGDHWTYAGDTLTWPAAPAPPAGETQETSDDATAELLAALDDLYPLPDDGKRTERAGRTALVVKRWMARTFKEIESAIPGLIERVLREKGREDADS